MMKLIHLVLFLSLITGWQSFAEEIEVPEEELARESVLPVFQKTRAVLNRSVVTEKHFEVGAGVGLEVNEPYYNDYMLNVMGTYNFSETGAFNVQGMMWMDGLSEYGDQLKAGRTGANGFASFDAEKAPHPVWAIMGNYQFIAYYGKISLTKNSVVHLNLFGLAGLGYLDMEEESTIAMNLGLGQNFFLTNHLGLRFDVRWFIYQGPNPPTGTNMRATDTQASTFDDRVFYNTQLALSAIFIL